MGKTMTKSSNLQRALEARRIANAEREAREQAIVRSLSEFLGELDKLDHAEQSAARSEETARAKAAEQIARIERELNERVERIRQAAEEKAAGIRQAAGAAAQVMRANGETVASIAAQSGQTQARVRELLRLADSEDHSGAAGDQEPGELSGRAEQDGQPGGGEATSDGHQAAVSVEAGPVAEALSA